MSGFPDCAEPLEIGFPLAGVIGIDAIPCPIYRVTGSGCRPSRTSGDETMANLIEQQIEELRAELRNAGWAAGRRQIVAELEIARAELAVAMAEQLDIVQVEPPPLGRSLSSRVRPGAPLLRIAFHRDRDDASRA